MDEATWQRQVELLGAAVPGLLARADEILADPALAGVHVPCAGIGGLHLDLFDVSLGALVRGWRDRSLRWRLADGELVYVYWATVHSMSGAHSVSGFSVSDGRAYAGVLPDDELALDRLRDARLRLRRSPPAPSSLSLEAALARIGSAGTRG